MVQERPTILLVMGILSIIFGAVIVLCGVCGLGASLFMNQMGNINLPAQPGGPPGNPIKDQIAFMEKEIPAYQAIQVVSAIVTLLFGVLLLIGGIGLIGCKSWARWLCVAVGVLLIFFEIASTGFQLGVVNPATERWKVQYFQKQGFAMPPQSGLESVTTAAVIGVTALVIIYCGVLVGVMFMPSVAAACSGVPARRGRGDEDDYDDRARDDDRYGRDRDRDDDEGRFRKRED